MSAAAAAASSALELVHVIDVDPPAGLKPVPPPTQGNCNFFGRAVSCLWPDYVFGTAEGIGGAGLAYTGYAASWYAFGALAIMELALGLGHGLYRRYRPYADLNAEVEALRHNADQWKALVAQEKGVAAQVNASWEAAKKDVEQYHKENEGLKGTIVKLEATAQSFDGNVQRYEKRIAELEQIDVNLGADVEKLKSALNTFKEELTSLVQANLKLKTTLSGVQQEVTAFGAVDERFAKVTDNLDARFRTEVNDLGKQVALAQASTRDIIQLLCGECDRLKAEVAQLKGTSAHLADTEARIERDEEQIRQLEQQAKEREAQLEQANRGFAPVVAAIDAQLPHLQDQQQHLTGAASALSGDADRLQAAGHQFSADVAGLSNLMARMQRVLAKKPGPAQPQTHTYDGDT